MEQMHLLSVVSFMTERFFLVAIVKGLAPIDEEGDGHTN
jgi:hypothetical protein